MQYCGIVYVRFINIKHNFVDLVTLSITSCLHCDTLFAKTVSNLRRRDTDSLPTCKMIQNAVNSCQYYCMLQSRPVSTYLKISVIKIFLVEKLIIYNGCVSKTIMLPIQTASMDYFILSGILQIYFTHKNAVTWFGDIFHLLCLGPAVLSRNTAHPVRNRDRPKGTCHSLIVCKMYCQHYHSSKYILKWINSQQAKY